LAIFFPLITAAVMSPLHVTRLRRDALRLAVLALSLTIGMAFACAAADSTTPHVDVATSPPAARTPAGLWLASTNAPAMLQLAPAQLAAGGHVSPAAVFRASTVRLHSLVGIAFDPTGRMWVASQGDSVLLAFSPLQLDARGPRAIESVIRATGRSLSAPVGIAFDARHRLWVANFGNGTLARFDSAQLAASGAPAPSAVIRGLARPAALAFDEAGSLWVSDLHAATIVSYDADQLETSGSPAPRVKLTGVRESLSAPSGLAFDSDGDLWVANVGNGTVVEFEAAQLAKSGTIAPHVTLSEERTGLIGTPSGLAFDDDGSLWVAGLDGNVTAFTREQLLASGPTAPSVSMTLDGHGLLWGAAFWPRPSGLPLN
jgi:sugar lactone lactonase YvrE